MKKYLRLTAFVVPLSFVTIFGFNNCGRFGQLNGVDNYGSSSLGSNSVPVEEVNSEKLGLPVALLSAEQTLSSMMSLANISVPSGALMNEYNARYGALAAGNDLSMANSPLLLGATSLAGEVCNGLLAQEKALAAPARSFFESINFAAGVNSVSDVAFNSSVRGMARQFWGRSETAEELSLLQSFKAEFTEALAANVRTQAASSSNLMLGTCAAMLSSMDAISY